MANTSIYNGFDQFWKHVIARTGEMITIAEAYTDENAVPKTRTVNGKALSSNITLTYSDVGAAAADHTHSYAGSASAGGPANSANALLSGTNTEWTLDDGFDNDYAADNLSAQILFFDDSQNNISSISADFIKVGSASKAFAIQDNSNAQNLIKLDSSVMADEDVDALGTNIAVAVWEDNSTIKMAGTEFMQVGYAGSARQLSTARKISLGTAVESTATSFNGSQDITIPVTSVKESYLSWGGTNFAGSYGCIDAAMVSELGANRLAFMPPSAIEIQYSTNNGSAWATYNTTDEAKSNLFNGNGTSLFLGASSATSVDKSAYQLRVIITTNTANVYTALHKFVIYCSTNGSNNCWCTIDGQTQANVAAGNSTWENFVNKASLAGWSGYNVINTPWFTTYGNSSSQYQKIRFTFGATHPSSSTYSGLCIMKILGFGGMGWTTPSNMAKTGHIYSWDYNQNAYFPSAIVSNGATVNGNLGVSGGINSGYYVNAPGFNATNSNGLRISQTSSTNTKSVLFRNDGNYLWTLCCDSTGAWYTPTGGDNPSRMDLVTGYTYFSKVYGAVWNDYAEFRISDCLEPGKVVCENGDDTLSIATRRLQPGASIISDTYGFSIGETDEAKCPVAVSGRVLAYGYEDRDEFKLNIGRPVCAGPNGTVSIMTDDEYKNYGYCAIGTISAVPEYEEWGTGKVKVNGRIWIKVV